ncbi:MAG: Ig-like domain-containing protein [Comamonadaceae bacterium]|nr:Ig-like domain-containing protein [Comamonadaceae bacterium]
MKNVLKLASLVLAVSLAACGGGGGDPGTTPGGGGGAKVASFDIQLDKNALLNNGLDEAKLTVVALDASNNPVSDANVKVSADSGIYTPDTSTTDASGKASGTVSIGGNKSNRAIGLTIDVGGQVKSESITVTGSELTINVPAVVATGDQVPLSVKVTDANSAPIANVDVSLGGTLGFAGTVKTNASGTADKTLTAAPAVGKYTVQITASGVTATRDVQVGSLSGGGSVVVPDAVGPISAASLSISPDTIAPNAVGSTDKRATLKAVFRDAQNRAVENVRVRFEIVAPGLGSGEAISTGTSTVYTDANGVANAEYIAASRSSPTNGVRIRACYGLTDAAVAGGACPQSEEATMTIAATAISITLGDNNELEKGINNLTYIKRFIVAVTDSAGNAVPNAAFTKSVDLPFYLKGPAWNGTKFSCPNEDANRNGFLDVGEDADGDGKSTPPKADVVISGDSKTGANGLAVIQVEYAQSVATWLEYEVKVTTNVEGSEGTAQKSYVTSFVKGDEENGSFLIPAYGKNACNAPN